MKTSRLVQSHSFLTLFLTLLVWLPAVYGVNLGDVFRVKQGTDKGGTDGRTDVIQRWLDDTVTLVDYILPKLQDPSQVDGGDRTLVRNLKSWFNIRLRAQNGIHSDDVDAYTALRGKFAVLDTFLKGQNDQWNQDANKPWLFFNSDWQEETELYFDGNGDPIDEQGDVIMDLTDPNHPRQANVRNWDPPNLNQLETDAQGFFKDMKERSGNDWKYVAYWSSDLKDYQLIDMAERRRPGGFCDAGPDEDFFALTIGNMYVDSVTLCEPAFTEKAEKHETIAEGMASDAATNDKAGTPLQETSPRSLTLFHELIHMTSDPDNTPDKGTKPTECLDLVRSNQAEEARNNPDSIVFFAWSYYLEMEGNSKYRWNTGKKVKS